MDIENGSQMTDGLEVSGLGVTRGEHVLFRDLSLYLAPGRALAVTGPNGAGKTSLLRAVAGLIRPDAGRVRLGRAADADLRDRLHLLGHADGLKGGRRARDELAFQAAWLGGDAVSVTQAVERLELNRLLDLECRRLSAGQRRRLAFARLLAAPRPLWLLDEPLAPLDDRWRVRVGEIMAEHLAVGGLILAAVHDPLPVAAQGLELGSQGAGPGGYP